MAVKLTTMAAVTVATAGTRQQISASNLYALSVAIQAKKANTGKIYVGDSSVSSTRGHELAAGETYIVDGQGKPNSLEEVNLADLYVDAQTNGEGVNVTYVARRST